MIGSTLMFIQQYIQEEEAVKALCLLPDAPADYNREGEAFVKRFFIDSFDMAPDMGMAASVPNLVESARDWFRSSSPRVVFQLKQYRHKKLGEYVRVYVSGRHRLGSYDSCWLVRPQPSGELRIFSNDGLCGNCGTLGTKDGVTCSYCGGRGWRLPEGEKVASWGTLLEVRKIVRPTNPRHAEEYDREGSP